MIILVEQNNLGALVSHYGMIITIKPLQKKVGVLNLPQKIFLKMRLSLPALMTFYIIQYHDEKKEYNNCEVLICNYAILHEENPGTVQFFWKIHKI